ncbi:hypothetical protein BJ944DRAFT_200982 [Cunninghamella echinulata]|nr:hypothetical protein BJ944DRAFT_200982 [Cunninghamella echinulata]
MSTVNEDNLTYLSDYKDTIDVLPMELQRNFTLIRQLDENAEEIMEKIAEESILFCNSTKVFTMDERKQHISHLDTLLNEAMKKGEEKFQLAKTTYDLVDRHCTRLDNDLQKFEDEQLMGPSRNGRGSSTSGKSNKKKFVAGHSNLKTSEAGRGRKKRKRDTENEQGDYLSTEDAVQHAQAAISLSDLPIDPNEPVYCYCQQVSYGEMVACDNDECDIEWFHIECVGLRSPPKGKWYCKNCIAKMKSKKKL